MASIRKRKLPSGKAVWQCAYVDAGGNRRSKHFDLKKDADVWLTRVKSDLQLGVHVADSASITVKQAARLWLERCDHRGLERSTCDAYRQHVDLHIIPLFGAKKLSQITTPAVHAFADELARKRSPDMVRRVVRSLGAIISEARRRGLAATNPVADAKIRIQSDRRKSKRATIPARVELRAILETASGKHRPLIVTAIFSGLRASELRGLRWRDIDLNGGVISVQGRVDAWAKWGPPKTAASYRDVPLAPYAVNVLREHRLCVPNGDDDLVFPTEKGTPIHHANMVSRIWNPLQIAAGLYTFDRSKADVNGEPVRVPRFNFHALRHAAASLFIEQGMTPKRVQTIMGHSSITVTFDIYGHLFEDAEADQAAVAAIEARLLG